MHSRSISIWKAFAVLALSGFLAIQALAGDTVRGKINSAGSGKISVNDDSGTARSIDVAASAKITQDGKKVTLEELTVGASVAVVTEKQGDKTVAVMITAESPL